MEHSSGADRALLLPDCGPRQPAGWSYFNFAVRLSPPIPAARRHDRMRLSYRT
jgi:hypothetical protein